MTFTKPTTNAIFTVTATPEWPAIEFETNATGPHTWNWSLTWGKFSTSGKEITPGNAWDARVVCTNLGGTLVVKAEAGNQSVSTSVAIRGTNPSAADIAAYLITKPNSAGFDKILEHESKCAHFNKKCEPIKSFDEGCGMCQLTTPTPSFAQVGNWQLNIEGGLKLFEQKRKAAAKFLGQDGRAYTPDQLKAETVCRWNGGSYHEWNVSAGVWVRKANILCDSKTGNIGWDMTDPANAGKTEAQLRKRDSASYSKPPRTGTHWKYLGVCYADRILG